MYMYIYNKLKINFEGWIANRRKRPERRLGEKRGTRLSGERESSLLTTYWSESTLSSR